MSEGDWLSASWMQTYTGIAFRPWADHEEMVDLIDPRDIAHALSQVCRYGGHTRRFYSVAEHGVLISRAVPEEDRPWGLMHDAAEAYLGDMVRPVKIGLQEYRDLEGRVLLAIASRFGLNMFGYPQTVKDADNRILLDERVELLTPPPQSWDTSIEDLEPLGCEVLGWYPPVAELEFLQRMLELELVTPQEIR